MYWVKSRPMFTPPAEWTREEDKELLALAKKYYGRWKDVPYELSHTPVECDVRWFELTYPRFCEGSTRSISKKCPKITLLPPKDLELSRNASQLVSKEDNEAGNSVSESDSAQLGTVAAANSAALEATPGIDAPMTISLRNTWASMFNTSLDDLANDTAIMKLRECEEKVRELRKEKDQLVKQKDLAIKEIHLRRAELGKVRDHVAFLEAAILRAEEKQRNAGIEVEAKVMEQREAASLLEKQFLLAYIYALEAEFQRNASQLVSKEDNEAGNSVSESDSAQLGTVAAANSAALEATPGIDAPMTISLRNTWASMFNTSLDDLANDTAIMKCAGFQSKAPAEEEIPTPVFVDVEKTPGPSAPPVTKKRKAESVEAGDDSDSEVDFHAIGDGQIADFALSRKNKRLRFASGELNRTGLGRVYDGFKILVAGAYAHDTEISKFQSEISRFESDLQDKDKMVISLQSDLKLKEEQLLALGSDLKEKEELVADSSVRLDELSAEVESLHSQLAESKESVAQTAKYCMQLGRVNTMKESEEQRASWDVDAEIDKLAGLLEDQGEASMVAADQISTPAPDQPAS